MNTKTRNFKKLFFASVFIYFFQIFGVANASTILCTKYNNVNFRNGPSIKFTILYKIFKKDYPVSIIETIDGWHAVVDFVGDKMWVSSGNLSTKCGGIVKKKTNPHVKLMPYKNSFTIFILEEGFILKDIKCYIKWCKVKIDSKTGWIEKLYIWGVE